MRSEQIVWLGRALRAVIFAASLFATVGCGTAGYTKYSELERGKSYWLGYDANRRGTYVQVASDGTITACAEPPPDAVTTISTETSTSVSVVDDVKAEGGLRTSSTPTILAPKDPENLLVRDAMYRMCELALRGAWKSNELQQAYTNVLQVYSGVVCRKAEAKRYDALRAYFTAVASSEKPVPPAPELVKGLLESTCKN